MNCKPFPGYEAHLENYRILAHGTEEEKREAFAQQQHNLRRPDTPGVVFEDTYIPGPEQGQQIRLRICRPEGHEGEKLPIVLDIHGGGWVGGIPEIDDYRNSLLAKGIPAIVVCPEYRLSVGGVHYPKPLLDCYEALKWTYENGAQLGGDPARIGIHGTSAGGNLTVGLLLYVRDHGGPAIRIAAAVNPGLSIGTTPSRVQNDLFALDSGVWETSAEHAYLGDLGKENPPIYAFPAYAEDVSGLPPMILVGSEYCPLRDDAMLLADRLLKAGSHCELIVTPGTGHGFCTVPGAMTDWTMNGICLYMQSELGTLQI